MQWKKRRYILWWLSLFPTSFANNTASIVEELLLWMGRRDTHWTIGSTVLFCYTRRSKLSLHVMVFATRVYFSGGFYCRVDNRIKLYTAHRQHRVRRFKAYSMADIIHCHMVFSPRDKGRVCVCGIALNRVLLFHNVKNTPWIAFDSSFFHSFHPHSPTTSHSRPATGREIAMVFCFKHTHIHTDRIKRKETNGEIGASMDGQSDDVINNNTAI